MLDNAYLVLQYDKTSIEPNYIIVAFFNPALILVIQRVMRYGCDIYIINTTAGEVLDNVRAKA